MMFVSLLPSQPLGSSTSANKADQASLTGVAANIELSVFSFQSVQY
jgi:hypothetical protein